MAALDAPPALHAVADLDVEAPHNGPHHREVFLILRRRPSAGGSRPHDVVDPTEALGGPVVGYIKGKSAIHIAREFAGRPRNFVGQHFRARGCFVSTVGRNEGAIREYIRTQELEDRRHDQLRLDEGSHL